MFNIKLDNGKEFECEHGETILDAAFRNNVSLEYSCKTGKCGACIAPILEGKTTSKNEEIFFLENEAINTENILTCSRTPETDISLGISDLGEIGLLKIITLPCKINKIINLTKDIKKIELRIPPTATFDYVPGQYINLEHKGIRRSYSIASDKRADSIIELHVKRVYGGKMSDYIFKEAKEGDLLRFEGPFGTFSFRDDFSSNIVFLATGTGIAPIKAILERIDKSLDGNSNKDFIIIWGAKYSEDIYYNFENIKIDHQFFPVISRENISKTKTYVQDKLLDLNINLQNSTVYACGSNIMIKDAHDLLIKNGLNSKNFYSDAFLSSEEL